MSSTEAKGGETARSTYRIPVATLAKLDELATGDAAESGREPNRTQVIIDLINREHTRRAKARSK